MSRFILILICLTLSIGWYLFFHSSREHPIPPKALTFNSNSTPAPAIPQRALADAGQTNSVRPGNVSLDSTPAAASLPPITPFLLGSPDNPPQMDPATVLSNVRIAVNQYSSMFGGNPVGPNPEVTSALNGSNPRQVTFLNAESGMRINGRGELVDYWGTPFFFHQLSGTEMEIRSAGPDKHLWTPDDLVTK